MIDGVFSQKLDLLITLRDTTTGLPVAERYVSFNLGGKDVRPMPRPNGNYLLVNHGREDGPMRILTDGFEPFEKMVEYEKLDPHLPTLDAFLIPSENRRSGQRFLSLSGQLEGITSIEAVKLGRAVTGYRDVDRKRRVITTYMPNRRVVMPDQYYGIANVAEGMFESVEIIRELPDNKAFLKEPLNHDFPQNSPVFRLIYGKTDADGNYLFRVRDDGGKQKYIVKYIVNGETKFETIDFAKIDEKTTSLKGE